MKKRTAVLLSICCIGAAVFAGCASSYSASSSKTEKSEIEETMEKTDVLVKHELYKSASGDGWTEYTGVYYGDKTDILYAYTIETQFEKSAGYTKEMLEAEDIESDYPGFNSLSCGEKRIIEDEDSVSLIILFKGLDEYKNAQEMVDKGFINVYEGELSETKLFKADSFREELEDNGAKVVSSSNYDKVFIYTFD